MSSPEYSSNASIIKRLSRERLASECLRPAPAPWLLATRQVGRFLETDLPRLVAEAKRAAAYVLQFHGKWLRRRIRRLSCLRQVPFEQYPLALANPVLCRPAPRAPPLRRLLLINRPNAISP